MQVIQFIMDYRVSLAPTARYACRGAAVR